MALQSRDLFEKRHRKLFVDEHTGSSWVGLVRYSYSDNVENGPMAPERFLNMITISRRSHRSLALFAFGPARTLQRLSAQHQQREC